MQDLDFVLRTAAIKAGVKLVVAFGMGKAIYQINATACSRR
jgi:hypothetical protein